MTSDADSPAARALSPARRWALLLSGLAVGGTLLYITARDVDLGEAMAIVFTVNTAWLLPLAAVVMTTVYLRSARWRLMFPDASRPTPRHAFDVIVIGRLGNTLLPGRLGDILRATIIAPQVRPLGFSGTLATIVLEKIFDSLTILALLGVVLLLLPVPGWLLEAGAVGLAIMLSLLSGLWLLDRFSGGLIAPIDDGGPAGIIARVHQFVSGIVQRFASGLYALQDARHLARLVAWTLLLWTVEGFIYYFFLQAFAVPVPFLAAWVCMVFLCIGLMLPAAPGFIGAYQFFIVAALQLFGVPDTTAFAVAVFMNLYHIFLNFLAGLLVVTIEGGFINLRRALASLFR